jgi:putative Mn2+ efflux pump MntP
MAVLWLAAVLIAITSNLDNLTIGIALGLRPLRVTVVTNVAIAVLTMIGTAAAMSLGSTLGHALPPARAGLLGGLALIGIGAWMTLTGIAGLRGSVTGSGRQTRNATTFASVDDDQIEQRVRRERA